MLYVCDRNREDGRVKVIDNTNTVMECNKDRISLIADNICTDIMYNRIEGDIKKKYRVISIIDSIDGKIYKVYSYKSNSISYAREKDIDIGDNKVRFIGLGECCI